MLVWGGEEYTEATDLKLLVKIIIEWVANFEI